MKNCYLMGECSVADFMLLEQMFLAYYITFVLYSATLEGKIVKKKK